MIIDFNSLDEFIIDKFKSNNTNLLFDLNNVKIINDFYCGYLDIDHINNKPIIESKEQSLINANIMDIIDNQLVIKSDQLAKIEFNDSTINFIINDNEFDISYYWIDSLVLDMPLTDFGQQCAQNNDNIEDIFDASNWIIYINKFNESAPIIFKEAFSNKEIIHNFKFDEYTSDQIQNIDKVMEYLTEMISTQLKNATAKIKNIDGPDDFMFNIYKDIDRFNNETVFTIYGNFACCFYSLDKKLNFNKLYNTISNYKFEAIKIYDITKPDNNIGTSMNGIYSDDSTLYINASYKLTFTLEME